MYHCFVPQNCIDDSSVRITGSDVNHIKNVMRMKEGDRIYASDGEGRNVICAIASLSSEEIICDITDEYGYDTELSCRITLYQALPKADKMETLIEKCTELGVSRFVPVETRNCVVKLDDRKARSKVERWQKIAESAAKQSQRSSIPEVSEVMSFRDALKDAMIQDMSVIPYENTKDNGSLNEMFAALPHSKSVGIIIGPEGGFTEDEIKDAIAAGVEPITLGKRILRTETAGMALVAAIMLELERR